LNCGEISSLLPAYIEGQLDARRAAEFDAHFKTCSSCLQELERQAQVDAQVRDAVLSEPVDVTDIDRLIRENLSTEFHRSARQQFESVRRRWVAATAGIIAILVLLAVGYHTLFGRRLAGVYAAAAADHRLEIVQQEPRAWFTSPSQIESLAQSQGVAPAAVEALASGAYHLDRGKLCWLDGRIFLHLGFSEGARRFSFYLRPREAGVLPLEVRETEKAGQMDSVNAGSEQVAAFQTSTLAAIAVTDQPGDAALQFAQFASAKLQ
jgi:anti-sigma factor RsiW